MNRQADVLFNISSFSSSGVAAGKIGPSAPTHLGRLVGEALTRSLYKREGLESSGRQLAALARHAYFIRQMETVEQASRLMLSLPLSEELKSVAHYYQAICAWQPSQVDAIRQRVESLLWKVSPLHRPQALLTIGAAHFGQGHFDAALPFYLAAAQAAAPQDLLLFAAARKMAAVVRGVRGDHRQALLELERLFPLVRAVARQCPAFYYEYLNSYAVELGEAGRLEEAAAVCGLTLRSAVAAAYPEFAQTRDELAARRTAATPSIVAVPSAASAIISSSQTQAGSRPEPVRLRFNILFQLKTPPLYARMLTHVPARTLTSAMSARTTPDWLVESSLPREPPALS